MTKSRALSFFFSFLICLCGCQTAVNLDQEKAQLLQADRDFSKASLEKGAAEAFRLFLADDAVQLPAGADPVFGNEAISEGMKDAHIEYVMEWEPRDGAVSRSADLGYTWGIYTFSWKDDQGESHKSFGKYLKYMEEGKRRLENHH